MYQPLQQNSAPGDSPHPTQGVVMKTPRPSTYASRNERRRLVAGVAAVAMAVPLLSLPAAGIAHDHERRQRSDHDEARRALLSGKVLSLRQVLDIVAREYPGEPVEVEFEHDDGMYRYELKLLQASGRIIKMKVDASSGKIISVKARDKEDDD